MSEMWKRYYENCPYEQLVSINIIRENISRTDTIVECVPIKDEKIIGSNFKC